MTYLDNIPQAMRERNQWMLTDRNKAPLAWDWGEERTYAGSKNRTDQLMSYATARALAEQEGLMIGYITSPDDPFTIIDLDFKDDKVYDADAAEIKRSLLNGAHGSSYIESSLSGKGYHIVVRGKLAHDFNAQSAGIECYGNKGFVVMTGRMPEACAAVEPSDQQPVLSWLADKYKRAFEEASTKTNALDWNAINHPSAEDVAFDDALIASMSQWHNAANLERYFYGQDLRPDGSGGSEGDLALMQAFLKFTKSAAKSEASMRMFLKTPRAKAREPHKTRTSNWDQYLARTIRSAQIVVARDERRAKDFDFSAGTHAMMEAYQQQIAAARQAEIAPAEQAPAVAGPINSAVAPGTAAPAPAPFKGFSWLNKHDIENAPALEWAVKGLYPVGGLAAIYGESGAGKSFVGIDLIAAIAEGERWFNMRTKKLPVSVFALEGEGGLKGRVKAWELQNKREYPESVLFWDGVKNGSFALRDSDPRSDENKTRLVQLCADLNASGRRGGVVVIDTLNQASDGADENSSRDMGELLKAMKLIQRETGSLVLIVHHSTKSKENQSMRGHSSLFGAMDGIMEVIRDVYTEDEAPRLIEGRRGWIAKKVKDGRDGYTKLFDMKEHQVGFDEDGPVMSIAIQAVASSAVDPQTGEIQEVQNSGTLKAPAPARSGGKRSGGGAANRAGSAAAPAVTRPSNQPTYSQAERNMPQADRAGGESLNAWGGMKPQEAIKQAIADSCKESKSAGRYGENGAICAPRSEAVERAIVLRNYPNPSLSKRDLQRAIDAMIAGGKLGYAMESGRIQWLWLKE